MLLARHLLVQIEVQSDENRLGPKANMDKTMQTSDKPSELAKQEEFGKTRLVVL